MNVPASVVLKLREAVAAAGSCLLAASCASPSVDNAPPAIVEECRQEVGELTDPDRLPPVDDSLPERPSGEFEPIDDARQAQREQDGSSLASWPEEVLLYRCLTSRGVVLTEEQATVLAEWQSRMQTADPE